MQIIYWFEGLEKLDLAILGGKGVNLVRLRQAELPVPSGFVITTAAYRAFIERNNLTNNEPAQLHEQILKAPLPSELRRAITEAYVRLGVQKVAVRSSATSEDLEEASFAGQHDSYLNVSGEEEVLKAVRGCWASLWSPRAVNYRQQHQWNDPNLALAVVVQVMVPAQWAGVMFTADPVSEQRNQIIVEAVAGLGEALVSGEARPERLRVDKERLEVVGEKPELVPIVKELAHLGLQIEQFFGVPQDIEWAYADGRCFILQARPLTALPEENRLQQTPPRRYTRLQRAAVPTMVDHLPVPPYPFDMAFFFRPLMEKVFAALRSVGLKAPPLSQILVEVADGVVQVVPPVIRPTFKALTLPLKLPRLFRAKPEAWLAQCRETLVEYAEQVDKENLAALTEQALFERIEVLQQRLFSLIFPRFAVFPRGLLASAQLKLLLRVVIGKQAETVERELLVAIPCVTTEANEALTKLAQSIRASSELRNLFLITSPEELPTLLKQLPAGQAVFVEVANYLERFGRRETVLPSAASPAWRDDPSMVYGLLKGLVSGESTPPKTTEDAERAKDKVIGIFTKWSFGLGHLLVSQFKKLLEFTRSFLAFREDSHFYMFMTFPVVRRLALELGRRMTEEGVLKEASDIFFLELDELKSPESRANLWNLVLKRKRARSARRYTTVPAELLEPTHSSDVVQGAAVSRGQAIGLVRVISNEREFWKLQRGDILVAPYTNPTWTPLFALSGAVVVDAGGVSSHAAIVAREYGIPAVMGTFNGTTRLHDGQRVLVDADKGRVVVLEDVH
jgi:rifampicin phosphotransferase